MDINSPLVDNTYILEKFPGKGGWTYAEIHEIVQDKSKPFGWVTVQAYIDDIEIRHCKLMPMGNGRLFLPVKAEIRHKIGKQAGDTVRVILFADTVSVYIPEELHLCLASSPQAQRAFTALSELKKDEIIEHIYSAKTEEIKVQRIVELLQSLEKV